MSGETRKLQKVGGGTYTVSIPKEWANDQSLSAGDTVFLYPDGDGSLVVCHDDAETAPTSAAVAVPADGDDETLDRILSAAYAAGIERLRLTTADGFDGDTCRTLEWMVRDRTGMRVTESTPETVEVRTLLDDDQVSVERSVVQLQFVALSLFRTAIDAALAENAPATERIDGRRAEARRLTMLVTRQFNRSLSAPTTAADIGIDRPTAFDCYRTAAALDRIAEQSTAVATLKLTGPPAAVDALRSVADATRHYLEKATTTAIDGDSGRDVDALTSARDELTGLLGDADDHVAESSTAIELLCHMQSCVDSGDRIATVAREAALRRESLSE